MIEINFYNWIIAFLGAFILGLAKAGIKGPSVAYATLLALVFGSRASTGILVPLLLVGDTFAVFYYQKHIVWKHLIRILFWMILGVIIGVLVGKDLEEEAFKKIMAVTVITSIAFILWWDFKERKSIPNHLSFVVSIGLVSGFSSMITGVAGALPIIYLLAMQLQKNHFIGTLSLLIFLVNFFKVPFHVFVWKTITVESLTIDSYLLPFEILGLLIGVRIVGKVKNTHYRLFVLVLTAIGALFLFF